MVRREMKKYRTVRVNEQLHERYSENIGSRIGRGFFN